MDKQKTIQKKISFEGKGLHTGDKSKIELLPANANSGIVFSRRDIADSPMIKADMYSMADPQKFPRRTSVGNNGVYVHTVEHLMAALSLLGIDNIQANIWGEEVPGLDGSAKEFVNSLQQSGIVEQESVRDEFSVKEPLWVEEGDSSITVLPAPHTRVAYILKYDNPFIGAGFEDVIINGKLDTDLYQARTFCLEDEVKPLMDMGLGKGSNYENTLVVSQKGIIQNKTRVSGEFAKHKILDLIGDLYLAGPFKGHVIAVRSGHSLNIKLLEKLRRYRDKSRQAEVSSQAAFIPDGGELNVQEIMKIIPHRYPFLLVDRITHLEKGKKAVGIKNLTMTEAYFQGHFPERPVMPGVLIVEAMAQVGAVLMLSCEEHRGKLAYFMALNEVKFRRTVMPGDQLVMEVEAGKVRSKTGTFSAKAFVNGKLAVEGELMFALVE